MKKYILILLTMLVSESFVPGINSGQAFAEINVVATLPWIGSIVREIGKDKINITVLVKLNQDPHYIEAKPGMILSARSADIIMYNGLDLETGYLPVIIESSRNPKIQPGMIGNLDCSKFIEPIERNPSADRSMGDVHPLGNPHYHLSPRNIIKVAEGIEGSLSNLDGANAEFYKSNLSSFQERLKERERLWNRKSIKDKKFIAFHKYFEYLATEFGFQIIDYIEPKPGIPPSASHIERLINIIKRVKIDAILTTSYGGKKEIEFISGKTGVKSIVVPQDVGATEDIKDWFILMDKVLESIDGGDN